MFAWKSHLIDEYERVNSITSPNTSEDEDVTPMTPPALDVVQDFVEQARIRRRASLLGLEPEPTLKISTSPTSPTKSKNPLPKRAVSLLGMFRKSKAKNNQVENDNFSTMSSTMTNPSSLDIMTSQVSQLEQATDQLDKSIVELRKLFEYQKPLGQGNFGQVVLVKVLTPNNSFKSSAEFAVKIVSKQRMAATPKDMEMIIREVGVMHALHHPNIVKLWEAFESKQHVLMITDYCAGGDLQSCVLDRVKILRNTRGLLPEWACKHVMNSVFSALHHLHVRGIAHRDLKLENVMLVHQPDFRLDSQPMSPPSPISKSLVLPDTDARLWQDVKLTDFGLAGFKDGESQLGLGLPGTTASPMQTPGGMGIGTGLMNTRCGTMAYSAPEIIHGRPYNFKVDSWSAGVMMHLLLTSHFPFWSEDAVELMRMVGEGVYKPDLTRLEGVSMEAQDLIKKLLSRRPHGRPNAEDALKHAWFNDLPQTSTFGGSDTLDRSMKKVVESRFDKTNFFQELPVAAKMASFTLWNGQVEVVKKEMNRIEREEREKRGQRRTIDDVSPATPDKEMLQPSLHLGVGRESRGVSRSSSVESLENMRHSPKRRGKSPTPTPPPLSKEQQMQLDVILKGIGMMNGEVEVGEVREGQRELKRVWLEKVGLGEASPSSLPSLRDGNDSPREKVEK